MYLQSIIQKAYHSKIVERMLHTLVYELKRELKDCTSVLDLGCGPSSPLAYCTNIQYSVGVEAFIPYLEQTKRKQIHTEYLCSKIEGLDFREKSFDAVIMIEVLEHLPANIGFEILKKAEQWARKKIIVSSPNGFVPQKEIDGNPFQKHLSGWDYKTMQGLGFKCRGLAGLKYLRQEVENDVMGDDLMTSIRFWPKPFWFLVAASTQVVTYYKPSWAFELFSVKYLKDDSKIPAPKPENQSLSV